MPEEAEYVKKEDYIALQKRVFEYEAKFETQKDQLNKKQDEIYRLKKQVGVESTPKTPVPTEAPPPAIVPPPPIVTTNVAPTVSTTFTAQPPPVPEELSPHKFHAWEAGCTTCGIPNPQFKPEMKCDPKKGGCGGILGSFETALQMKNCPHCLKSVEAAPNNEEGLKKAMQFLKTPRITV